MLLNVPHLGMGALDFHILPYTSWYLLRSFQGAPVRKERHVLTGSFEESL
jgi:hypothetical protein